MRLVLERPMVEARRSAGKQGSVDVNQSIFQINYLNPAISRIMQQIELRLEMKRSEMK